MTQTLSGLEQGIFELTQIGVLTSLVSGITADFWDPDFKYTIGSVLVASAIAGLGLLTGFYNKANKKDLKENTELNYKNFKG